jgi:hypothetical protein
VTISAIPRIKPGQIHLGDRVDHPPRQMIFDSQSHDDGGHKNT